MTSSLSDDPPRSPEPTFADVMNGFSLDSGRGGKGRRWGRSRGGNAVELIDVSVPDEDEEEIATDTSMLAAEDGDQEPENAGAAASVRPYAWTRGRTKSGFDLHLAIETLVSTSPKGRAQLRLLQMEHRAVAELCEEVRSVAEVAALMKLPLGVARVLLGDMAGLGVVTVHQTAGRAGDMPDLALMERVLSGLRRL